MFIAILVAGITWHDLLHRSWRSRPSTLKADQTIGGTALNQFAPAFAVVMTWAIQGQGLTTIFIPNCAHHPRDLRPCPGGRPQLLEQPDLQVFLPDDSGRHRPVHRSLHRAVQDPLWPGVCAPAASIPRRRIPSALTRLQDAPCRVLFRPSGRHRRPGLHGGSRFRLQLDVGGYGFLALAVMIFGNWKPLPILGASLFFALFKVLPR